MTGSKLLDYIIMGLSTVATAGALALFVYTNMLFQRPTYDDGEEFAKLEKESYQIQVKSAYKIKKLIVNLKARSTRLRYVEMDLHLVPIKSRYVSVIEEKDAQIKDIIIDTAGRMRPDEINSVAGKILLETRIKKHINKYVGKPVVKEILFSKFIVQ
ncbi:MAG: flagellar basal body-associated FliL family protein [Bacteriovoracaceae bacterium]|nr:flagellar basal body-associated FliL family protein [Bacteriovoracaceae bacterium]